MSRSVYLASYKGTARGVHGLVNRGICALDKTIYSHTELCVGNPFDGVTACYSSSGMDGGVRDKHMQLSRDKWDVLYLHWVDSTQVEEHFEMRKGAGYDYWGTGRFAVPWALRQHPTKDFCSEFCLAAIGVEDAWRFSPAGAHALCLSMGAVQI